MRQLLPTLADVDPVRTYLAGHRPAPEGRPWIVVGMISSLDGASALDGRSGGLGGPADQAVFGAVRAIADVILVGAGTVRAERYGSVRLPDHASASRVEAGRSAEAPRLAIVTASGALVDDLEAGEPLLAGGPQPVVFTTEDADPGRVRALSDVADVRAVGRGRVDLPMAVASLSEDGAAVVVCEGGPTLNGALADAAMIDELCLSIAPMLAGGESGRILRGAITTDPARFELVSLLTEDGLLFGRWVNRTRTTAGAG